MKQLSSLVKIITVIDEKAILKWVRATGLFDDTRLLDAICSRYEIKTVNNGQVLTDERAKLICNRNLIELFGSVDSIFNNGKTQLLVNFSQPCFMNYIEMQLEGLLRDSTYIVESSMKTNMEFTTIVNYSQYVCRDLQRIYTKSVVAKCIRFTINKIVPDAPHIPLTIQFRDPERLCPTIDDINAPKANVAVKGSAAVLSGVSREPNALIDGDWVNYDWNSGYTCHQLGNGDITIQLFQPYIIGSFRMLLWDVEQRHYSYYILTSINGVDWSMTVDKRDELCSSWQVLRFEPRPIVFIRIVGTRNTANEVFHLIHFECPSTV
ncbi:hypothetical protein ACOME3_004429 [Neoechinorhynchus agilis]